MMEIGLNPAQRAAVEHVEGPLLVLAGAGSGKTRVLTARLAHLVAERAMRPDRILATTFTNRAAREMRHRVAALLGREPQGLWIGTFHSLSARLLRREAQHLGFTREFTIYDEADRLALLKRLLEQQGYAPKAFPPKLIQAVISTAKNRLMSPADLAAEATDRVGRAAADIYVRLQDALRQANAMDFDDLLVHPLTLFRERPDRLAAWQQRFDSILVDEFQDTNRAQYLLVRALAERHGRICAVGDDDQSIYSWRGADVRNMLEFQRDFSGTTLVRLEENYRSTQMILDAANALIAENTSRLGKTLFTARTGGLRVTIVAAADERDEAEWVVREVEARRNEDNYVHADLAVLYRTNAQSRAFEDALRRAGVPYRVVGAVSFYERREVKDLVAYLRLIVNPADDEAFLRAVQVPRRGIGDSSLVQLQAAGTQWHKPLLATAAIADRVPELRPQARKAFQEFAELVARLRADAGALPPAAALEQVVEAIQYESHLEAEGTEGLDRIENVRELLAAAAEESEEAADTEGTPLERFLATAALTTSTEQVEGDADGVTLLTVHAAKGLEWPVVVVAGLEDGLFPLSRALETPEGAEEERRLAYVAVTRARDRLYLTWARMRRRGGQLMPGMKSRFLDAVPPAVSEERRTSAAFGADPRRPWDGARRRPSWLGESEAPAWGAAPAPETESQDQPRYVKGERVRHRRFGGGTIRGLMGYGRDLKVEVEFDDAEHGTKVLVVAYAGLERDWE
ncbi:MAG TPA: UvrD-helicase domain-containing protein [Gemmatimonadales bacterium]|nr:UvrD-helicase domain-containing protein [Gemmatimonadales bacterium]